MDQGQDIRKPDESQIDWGQARSHLSRRLARKLMHEDHAILDDLTQEAMVRLLRAARRETVINLEGLLETIAQRTLVDFLRSRRIWEREPGIDAHETPDHPGLRGPTPTEMPPSLERIQFVVLEFFQARNAGCLELAHHYFAERNWLEVAQTLGRPHGALRKQWSRCVTILRDSARGEGGPDWEWA